MTVDPYLYEFYTTRARYGQIFDYGNKNEKNTIALMMMAILSGTAYAKSVQLTPNFSPESIALSTSAGMLSGKSHEMVYDADTGRKVSQLDWKIKNVAILKGDISWDAYSFLTLNA